jgi:hypothetical protein
VPFRSQGFSVHPSTRPPVHPSTYRSRITTATAVAALCVSDT